MKAPTAHDWAGDNVSPEHKAKFKSNLWMWILAALVLILTVAAMSLNVLEVWYGKVY